jgi:hypothetical protein
MSDSNPPSALLRELHCVRLATCGREMHQVVSDWKVASESAEGVNLKALDIVLPSFHGPNDVLSIVHQFYLANTGAIAPDQAAEDCREACRNRPLPGIPLLGASSVIVARVVSGSKNRWSEREAELLLAKFLGADPAPVRGGLLSPGIALWSRSDDLSALSLLCEDDNDHEREAGRILHAVLLRLETCVHKCRYYSDEYLKERARLLHERRELEKKVEAQAESLRRGAELIGTKKR